MNLPAHVCAGRRRYDATAGIALAVILTAWPAAAAIATASARPPNLVVILADDLALDE